MGLSQPTVNLIAQADHPVHIQAPIQDQIESATSNDNFSNENLSEKTSGQMGIESPIKKTDANLTNVSIDEEWVQGEIQQLCENGLMEDVVADLDKFFAN